MVGQSRAAAEATLTNAKLAAGAVTQQTSTEQSPGTVLEQSPAAGSSLPAGGTVNLTVAQAPTETAVPNVIGQNEAQASAALGRAGFTPQAVTQTTTEAAQVGTRAQAEPRGGPQGAQGRDGHDRRRRAGSADDADDHHAEHSRDPDPSGGERVSR